LTAETTQGAPRSLYVHIPFCARRCPYCDFAISVGGQDIQDRYVAALDRELMGLEALGRLELDTVFLGGGTPSLLRVDLLERLLTLIRTRFRLSNAAEVTIEVNPEALTENVARRWLGMGINRVSLGVQSLDEMGLRFLGRAHDATTAESAIEAVASAGFGNLNCDLIYAIPGQDSAAFARGLRQLLTHPLQHVSCYELTVEPGTPLARSVQRKLAPAPAVDAFLSQREIAGELLAAAGFGLYEVSNYARPGFACRHNLGYWNQRPYLAVGCGSHGLLAAASAELLGLAPKGEMIRYWHLRDAATYIRAVMAGGRGWRGDEWLGPDQVEMERVACGLRLAAGVALRGERQLTRARELAEIGLLTVDGQVVRPTERGFTVLDRVTLELCAA
jgi:oxygen-independent coproporphyrinogen-3 oxidase